jgi:DHA2 family multidrug resistance protein
MPVVGKLTERVDSRALLGVGLLINAYALWYMAGFNLQIDFATAVAGRVIQGLGMPLFFVSLTFLTYATIPREQMNNASSIFNLLRNLGGSFGVAFVTTLLARRSQLHQSRLVEHLGELNQAFSIHLSKLTQTLDAKLGALADHSRQAKGLIYQAMQREASALAFNDAFYLQAVLFLALVVCLLILRKPPLRKGDAPPAH